MKKTPTRDEESKMILMTRYDAVSLLFVVVLFLYVLIPPALLEEDSRRSFGRMYDASRRIHTPRTEHERTHARTRTWTTHTHTHTHDMFNEDE